MKKSLALPLSNEWGNHQEGAGEFGQIQHPLLGYQLQHLFLEYQPPGGDLLLNLHPVFLLLQLFCSSQMASSCITYFIRSDSEPITVNCDVSHGSSFHRVATACYSNTNANTKSLRVERYSCLYRHFTETGQAYTVNMGSVKYSTELNTCYYYISPPVIVGVNIILAWFDLGKIFQRIKGIKCCCKRTTALLVYALCCHSLVVPLSSRIQSPGCIYWS